MFPIVGIHTKAKLGVVQEASSRNSDRYFLRALSSPHSTILSG